MKTCPTQLFRCFGMEGTKRQVSWSREWEGYKDSALWRVVQAEQRYLVTADKGFADIRVYAPGTHAGVLLLRPDQDGIRPTLELLGQVLASYDLKDLAQTISVVTPRGIRIRRTES
jgi:predicted nuclease of predicted toxin-antitoxin system